MNESVDDVTRLAVMLKDDESRVTCDKIAVTKADHWAYESKRSSKGDIKNESTG